MVKLLRLTSEDNCNFNVNMDAELIVSEKAEIAVKNLTFDTLFEVLTVNNFAVPFTDTNGSVLFGSDTANYGEAPAFLTPVSYNNANYESFFTDMEATLNNTLEPINQADATGIQTVGQQFYAQWKVPRDTDFRDIEFRLTPVIVPLVTRDLQDLDDAKWAASNDFMSPSYSGANVANVEVITEIAPTFAGDMALVSRKAGEASGAPRSHYFVANNTATQWCQGSAVFWGRINVLTDNGNAENTNGFEIGLSKFQGFEPDADMDGTQVMFGLRVKRPQDPIEYFVPDNNFEPTGTPVVSIGNTPTNPVKPVTGEQDILFIQRERHATANGVDTRIVGYIFRDGQVPLIIFSYELTKAQQSVSLYPYICMYGDKTNAVLSQPSCTFDPFSIDEKRTGNEFIELLKPQYGNQFAGISTFKEITDAYTTPNETDIPNLNDAWFTSSYGLTADTELNIDRSILQFMGFEQSIVGDGTGRHTFLPIISTAGYPYGFKLEASDTFQATQSDNYVVVIDSHKVVSYDCSDRQNAQNFDVVGKRMNILATIPISDGTGIVEFDAAEVQYIDLDNQSPRVIRNLRLRVLDKALREISTTGLSVMTLLIKD